MTKSTEVDAYIFIKENLRSLGWDARNPERVADGQVYTQNECLSNPEIKRLLGRGRPENIVKVTEKVLWVIEAKRSQSELHQALCEAEERAEKLNESQLFQVRFISGVAGNQLDGFIIRNKFFSGGSFQRITWNGVEVTGLLSPSDLQMLLESGTPNIEKQSINEKLFLTGADRINEILHLGSVNPHQRAGVMAALLLSMLSDTGPNVEEKSPSILISDINARVQNVLKNQGKSEFYDYIRISLPASPDNHVKFRKALVDTIQQLNILNIRSAMNSGSDWLGAFYEVFLKYANWAQDLGIVLTPRHITRWAAEVMDIQVNDIVYDPTCGTGGFLVAAFDYVKRKSNEKQIWQFKQNSLFGIEQDPGVAALAMVNMIFRGDGKNNIIEGNCFAKFLDHFINNGVSSAKFRPVQSHNPPVNKVMMNPPFALKRSDEKEFRFIEQALLQMQHGGLLFSVLPYSIMVKPGIYLTWRKDMLLTNHTLLSVVSFPIDVFYPVGVTTVGVFIRKGIPHAPDQNVLWVRALTDGLLKSKGKRLPTDRTTNDLEDSKAIIKAFLNNPAYPVPSIDMKQKACPIDFSDKLLELVPENYLDQAPPSIKEVQEGIEQVIRDAMAFLVRAGKEHELDA